MAVRLALLALASLSTQARSEAVDINEKNWDKEVTQRVTNGQMVLVKFLAPWCGHCKKMKPDWDKLAEKFNYKTNAMIADVDCTTDDAKKLCETNGIQGYPSLKYFAPGLSPAGESYEEGRDYKDLVKFVKKKSKKPCAPATEENCDKKDKAYMEEIKDFDEAKLMELQTEFTNQLAELTEKQTAASQLFEKQKDEAMATQKKSEELKKKLSKLSNKVGYKLLILQAKTGGAAAKTEL